MDFLLSHGSYLAFIVVLTLTGTGLPLPEEVPIIAAGVLAAHNVLDPWIAAICCLIGAMAGDCSMYAIGYHFGRSVLKDHPWWVRFVTPQREAQVERMFRRHGLKVFFSARFLVILRSPLLLAAGILRVSFLRFFLIDLFSATVVVGSFFGLSYLYGRDILLWIRRTEALLTVIAVLSLALVGLYFWRRHRTSAATNRSLKTNSPPPNIAQTPAASKKKPTEPSEDKIQRVLQNRNG